jgi:glycosyltransferase involved in cell wall biosynthesis
VRVLHAIHDFLPRHRAGSEIYALNLCRELEAQGVGVHLLCAEYDLSRAHGSLAWRLEGGLGVTEVVNNWTFESFEETYEAHDLEPALAQVIDAVMPDVVHLHSLLNLSFGLPRLARARGAAVVGTLHDYTLVCPSGGQRVHAAEEWICHDIEPERCARCFRQHPFHAQWSFGRTALASAPSFVGRAASAFRRAAPGLAARAAGAVGRLPGPSADAPAIARRLLRAAEVMGEIDHLVAPSAALASEMARLGAPAERLEVADYGFPALSAERSASGQLLRLGFVGTLVWHKGAHLLLEALARLPSGGWTLDVWGDPEHFPAYVARLRELARGLPVRFRGAFAEAEAARVYGGMDVLVVPSLWLENSPLVIHEAFQCGVPVVGARLGGVAGLVEHERNGLLYDAYSSDALATALLRLLAEPELQSRLALAVPAVKTIGEDARRWIERYRLAMERRA